MDEPATAFNTRIDDFFSGGGSNGAVVLNGSTITGDGGTGDVLNEGSGGQDWFFVSPKIPSTALRR